MAERELSAQERRFCEEYVIDFDGKAAATRAGYSAKSAASQASRLLKRPPVRQYLKELRDKLTETTGIEAAQIIEELKLVAFARMGDFLHFSDAGELLRVSVDHCTKAQLAAVAEITVDKHVFKDREKGDDKAADAIEKIRLRLAPKLPALIALGNHLGMFTKGSDDATREALEAMRRNDLLPTDDM